MNKLQNLLVSGLGTVHMSILNQSVHVFPIHTVKFSHQDNNHDTVHGILMESNLTSVPLESTSLSQTGNSTPGTSNQNSFPLNLFSLDEKVISLEATTFGHKMQFNSR